MSDPNTLNPQYPSIVQPARVEAEAPAPVSAPVTTVTTTTPAVPVVNWWNEIQTAGFWLSLIAYVPGIYTFFHWPSASQGVVVGVLKIMAIAVGPIVTIVHLFTNAMKVKGAQARIAAVEQACVQGYTTLKSAGVITEVDSFIELLQKLHGNVPSTVKAPEAPAPAKAA